MRAATRVVSCLTEVSQPALAAVRLDAPPALSKVL
jgi:hypothetical protein